MKRLIFIVLATLTFAVLATSCDPTHKRTYKIYYQNGDTEIIRDLETTATLRSSDGGCWRIGNRYICGIREVVLLKKVEIKED